MISNLYLIRQSFKGYRCESDKVIFAWRVTLIFAYSPFKTCLICFRFKTQPRLLASLILVIILFIFTSVMVQVNIIHINKKIKFKNGWKNSSFSLTDKSLVCCFFSKNNIFLRILTGNINYGCLRENNVPLRLLFINTINVQKFRLIQMNGNHRSFTSPWLLLLLSTLTLLSSRYIYWPFL